MENPVENRLETAKEICRGATGLALKYFNDLESLLIKSKGLQDLVSQADHEVEIHIRSKLEAAFPNDGIVGEEFPAKPPNGSRYTWVIDPIDGTANFVRGIPNWAIVVACVTDDEIVLGAVYDPVHDEMFHCSLGSGAFLNDQSISVDKSSGIKDGLLGVGTAAGGSRNCMPSFIDELQKSGGIFVRTGSGALGIAFVACGRYVGYAELYMNAWDCFASLLLVKEAGGRIIKFEATDMLKNGGPVLAASPTSASDIQRLAVQTFGTRSDRLQLTP